VLSSGKINQSITQSATEGSQTVGRLQTAVALITQSYAGKSEPIEPIALIIIIDDSSSRLYSTPTCHVKSPRSPISDLRSLIASFHFA